MSVPLTLTLIIRSDTFKYDGINDICGKKEKKRVDSEVMKALVLSTMFLTDEEKLFLSQSYIISPGYANA